MILLLRRPSRTSIRDTSHKMHPGRNEKARVIEELKGKIGGRAFGPEVKVEQFSMLIRLFKGPQKYLSIAIEKVEESCTYLLTEVRSLVPARILAGSSYPVNIF